MTGVVSLNCKKVWSVNVLMFWAIWNAAACPGVREMEADPVKIPEMARDAWRGFHSLKENAKYEGVCSMTLLDRSTVASRIELRVKEPFTCLVQTYLDPGDKTKELGRVRVICRGPDYSFYLEKDQKDRPFALKGFVPKGEQEPLSNFGMLDRFLYTVSESPVRVPRRIDELIADKNYEISKFRLEPPDDPSVAEIEYAGMEADGRIVNGSFRLSPRSNWSVQDFQMMIHPPGDKPKVINSIKGKVEYGIRKDRFVPVKFEQTSTLRSPSANKDATDSIDWSLDNVEFGNLKDENFSLSEFGVAEVPGRSSHRTDVISWKNWPLWGSFIATLLGAICLRTYRRRTRF